MSPTPCQPARNLLRLLAVVMCLTLSMACKSNENRQSARSEDPFKDDPKVTADVHYATAQVFESKIQTQGANGRLVDEEEATQLRTAALSQYAAGLKLEPNHTPSLYRSAVLLTEMKRHEAAIAMWERYVSATGRTPNSLVNLGLANELAGRSGPAEQAYREAAQIDPANKPAQVNLGILLAKQGQLQPAQAALSTVLPPAAVHWHIGVALQAAGRMQEADQQFRAAAALDAAYSKRPAAPPQSASVRE